MYEIESITEGDYKYKVGESGVVEITTLKREDERGFFNELTRPDHFESFAPGFEISQSVSAELLEADWSPEADCNAIFSAPNSHTTAVIEYSKDGQTLTEAIELKTGTSVFVPKGSKVSFKRTSEDPCTIIAMRSEEMKGLPESIAVTNEKIPGLTIFHTDSIVRNGVRFRRITPQNWRQDEGNSFKPGQASFSYTKHMIARGTHAENMTKYVTTIGGRIYAFFTDFRYQSQGEVIMVEIQPGTSVYIPDGVGNSFVTTDQDAHYYYLVELPYPMINEERQKAFSLQKVFERYQQRTGLPLPFNPTAINLGTERDTLNAETDYDAMVARVRDNQ